MIVGVVAGPDRAVENHRVGRPDAVNRFVDLGELLDHLFLVRNGDAQAADAQRPGLVDEAAQILPRHAERHVDLVQSEVGESRRYGSRG